jgi:hypothetical protein
MAVVDKVFGVEFDIGGPLAERVLSGTAKSLDGAFTTDEGTRTINMVDGLFAIARSIDRLADAVVAQRDNYATIQGQRKGNEGAAKPKTTRKPERKRRE